MLTLQSDTQQIWEFVPHSKFSPGLLNDLCWFVNIVRDPSPSFMQLQSRLWLCVASMWHSGFCLIFKQNQLNFSTYNAAWGSRLKAKAKLKEYDLTGIKKYRIKCNQYFLTSYSNKRITMGQILKAFTQGLIILLWSTCGVDYSEDLTHSEWKE